MIGCCTLKHRKRNIICLLSHETPSQISRSRNHPQEQWNALQGTQNQHPGPDGPLLLQVLANAASSFRGSDSGSLTDQLLKVRRVVISQ